MSDEAERGLLVKLKTECGYQFTSKLESMFTDIKTSRDTMQARAQGRGRRKSPLLSVCCLALQSPRLADVRRNVFLLQPPACGRPPCRRLPFRHLARDVHSTAKAGWRAGMLIVRCD